MNAGYLGLVMSVLLVSAAPPQTGPEEKTEGSDIAARVAAYGNMDRLFKPPKGAILFAGSSTIEAWTSLATDFPFHAVLNRGIRSSTYRDLMTYEDRLIMKYRPSKLVLYSGDNDMASGATPSQIRDDARKVIDYFHGRYPEVDVFVLSIKPSPARAALLSVEREANAMLRKMAADSARVIFVDVATALLDPQGTPRGELFRADRLHMNAHGYAIWTSILTPYLMGTDQAPVTNPIPRHS